MATYVWNAFNGPWNTGSNWTPNGVPGSGDLALVGAGTVTNGTPDLSGLIIVNETIVVTAAFQLTLGGATLDAATQLTMANSGTTILGISGTTTNSGQITVIGASASSGETDFYFIPGTGASFNNAGTISLDQNSRMLGIGTLTNTGLMSMENIYQVPYAFTVIGNDTIVNNGRIVINGSASSLASDTKATLKAVEGTGTIEVAKAQITFAGTVASGQTVVFNDALGSLNLNLGTTGFSGTIGGFQTGDTIDLGLAGAGTLAFAPGISGAPGILTISGSTIAPVTLAFAGAYTAESFALTPNGGGDSILTAAAICFCTDTLIRTPDGDIKVQHLKTGDRVVTTSGAVRPIVWIGTGRVTAIRGQRGPSTPVIVRKGALAENVPFHDLRVTKGHSLFLDDVLIPVEFLVNHISILWDDRAQEVDIWHVELAEHDVLVANGAPAESYRDDGNRWLFQNGNSGWDQGTKPTLAPVLTGGPIVDAVWRRLLERCGPRPAVPLTGDPDLHLLIDGRRLDAAARHGLNHLFHLPARPRELRIASRASAPQELGLARDPRPLGVALRRIVLMQDGRRDEASADRADFNDGFHPYEAENDWRWTDGEAVPPAALFDGFDGPLWLELHLGATTRYHDRGVACQAA